jgi:NADH-quinone oxidoreductase subunit J
MSGLQIIFIIVAALTLGAGLLAVTVRNLVHAALWLIVALFGVAIFFVLLNAGFLAVAQVVVYIGAIAILIIFAIMLTQNVAAERDTLQLNANWIWSTIIAVVVFVGITWIVSSWSGFSTLQPAMSGRANPLTQLGNALVSPTAYLIPFEVASVLLLAALIGAIIIAWDRK